MKRLFLLLSVAGLAFGALACARVLAQSETAWGQPMNLSQSGSASLPSLAAAPAGTLHAIWWDNLLGEQYARGTPGVTQTIWTKPVTIAGLWGERRVMQDTQSGRSSTSLSAPRDTRLSVDAKGSLHALWLDAYNQLRALQNRGNAWDAAIATLSDATIAFDVATDLNGALVLAYVRPNDASGTPAGIYYRSTGSGEWSAPVLVYASPYFRVTRSEEVHVSVAGDGAGTRLVAWDDTRLGQSFYAVSADSGRTWSSPLSATGSDIEAATRPHVTASSSGEWIMFWQDPSRLGCTLSQRLSTDGGKSWQAPKRILTNLSQCPGRWKFALGGDKRPWLLGVAQPGSTSKSETSVIAAWDGQAWSSVVELNNRFREAPANKSISLGSVDVALAGQRLGVIGIDGNNDAWAVHNTSELNQFLPAITPAWLSPWVVSDQTGPGRLHGLPVAVAAEPGRFFAMWSQSSAETERGVALYISSNDGVTWSRAAQVLKSPAESPILAGAVATSKAEQPALAVDSSRLHAVWSGGSGGDILYSWSYVQDATSPSGWSTPLALPLTTKAGSWPDIVAGPNETLHVVYAIPYNEGRGIYYAQSSDGGNTWAQPSVVLDAAKAGWDSADKPRLALDSRANVLHAVWLRTHLPGGTSPQAVYYANSKDAGKTWSTPARVAEGLVDWPRIAVLGPDQVMLVWNQARSGNPAAPVIEVWSQFSTAGGERWSAATRVGGLGEVSGPASLVSDGAQAFLVGIGPGAGGEDALVHARWNGEGWEGQEKTGLGQDYAPGNAVAAALATDAGKLGAVMLVWAKQADGSSRFGVWATQRDISALAAAAPMPTFTPLPTSTARPTATPQPTATAKPQLPVQATAQVSQISSLSSSSPLLVSGGLAAIIVISLLALQFALNSRRR